MIESNYDRLQSGLGSKEKYIRRGEGVLKKLKLYTGRLRPEFCTLTLKGEGHYTRFLEPTLPDRWSRIIRRHGQAARLLSTIQNGGAQC